jgi:adenylate cyclase
MWTITMRSLTGEPREYPVLTSKISIGRRSDNDIVITDSSASRYHAEIEFDQSQDLLTLHDLGSTNGTFVNRERLVDSCNLTHNDVIRIGEHVLNIRRHGTKENLAIIRPGTHILTRDVLLESIDQNAVLMYEVARKLNTILDIDRALQEVSNLLKLALGAEMCEVITADKFGLLYDLGFPSSIAQQAIEMKAAVNIPDVNVDSAFFGASASLFRVHSVLCVPILSGDEVLGLIYMYKTDPLQRPFDDGDLQLAIAISHQAALTIQRMQLQEQVNEEQRIRQLLQRFVSPSEAEYIIRSYQTVGALPGLSEQRVTVLFADIADSTGLAERLGPKSFGEILSRYYQEMSDIIFDHDGMIDKYLGDGIMAVFGMTGDKSNHEERAVHAGLMILEHIEKMNLEISEDLFIGVGVNTGPVVAGYVGTDQRVELTVLGDTVNVASGLQTNARPNRLLIGPGTMAGITGRFETKRVGSIHVKGRARNIQAHEVIRIPGGISP